MGGRRAVHGLLRARHPQRHRRQPEEAVGLVAIGGGALLVWQPQPVCVDGRRQLPLRRRRRGSPATSYIYMLPLGGSVTKPWGKSDYGFPCCWGTLSESFAKLSDTIFFTSTADDAFYVNLYESATAAWAGRRGVVIEQQAYFPADPKRTATLTCVPTRGRPLLNIRAGVACVARSAWRSTGGRWAAAATRSSTRPARISASNASGTTATRSTWISFGAMDGAAQR